MNLREMVEKFGKTRQAYYDLHRRGRLKLFLEDPEKFKFERYKKETSKYIRKYGMTVDGLLKFLSPVKVATIYDLDRAGLLGGCVKQRKEEEKESANN